eukprot:TRINITY_DN5756_c0_g1_i1.p1 TRINITY_DN5756_c0_g1~~TRINITY_DN5756_c0_g1_i1.p1  ORF type:complete len:826 (+),score=130.26 TRINITY_DN5756_c0_g1_i1:675-3152(+)
MDIENFEAKELDSEAIFNAFQSSPNAELAKSLLQLWSFLRLEFPLPLFIFDPKVIINSSPSRRDLNPSWPLFQSLENANLAIDTLVELGLVRRVRQYDGLEHIRCADYINVLPICLRIAGVSDAQFASGALDSALLEVTKFFCTVYPKPNLAVTFELLVERLHIHGLWLSQILFANRLKDSNILPELKEYLNTDDVLLFLVALQFRSGDVTTDQMRAKLFNPHQALKRRFKDLKQIIEEIKPPLSERGPQLRYAWEVATVMSSASEENDMLLLGVTEDFLEKNAKEMSTADWMFAHFVKLATCASWTDKGLPKKEDIMRSITNFKRDPLNAQQTKTPEWHDEAVKLTLVWFGRTLVEPTSHTIANIKSALLESAAKDGFDSDGAEILRRQPFLHELLNIRDYIKFCEGDIDNLKTFSFQTKFMPEHVSRYHPMGLNSTVLRVLFFTRFRSQPLEQRLAPMYTVLQDAVDLLGPFCPDIAMFIATTLHTVGTVLEPKPLPPGMGKWIIFAQKICRYQQRQADAIRYADAMLRLASLTLMESEPQLAVMYEAIIAAFNEKIWDDVFVCEIIFAYANAMIQGTGDENEQGLRRFVDTLRDIVGSLTSQLGAKGVSLLSLTYEAILCLESFSRGPFDVGARHFMALMTAHGRSSTVACVYLMRLFLPKLVNAATSLCERTNRPFDITLCGILISTCEYFFFFHSGKLIETKEGEYENEYGPLLVPYLKLLKENGNRDYVVKFIRRQSAHVDDMLTMIIQKNLSLTEAFEDPEEEPTHTPSNGNNQSKKKGKKSRDKDAGSSRLILVGGAAGLVGILGAVGLLLILGDRK